jgi:hypothetical protein
MRRSARRSRDGRRRGGGGELDEAAFGEDLAESPGPATALVDHPATIAATIVGQGPPKRRRRRGGGATTVLVVVVVVVAAAALRGPAALSAAAAAAAGHFPSGRSFRRVAVVVFHSIFALY